jgi:hypothetical protein
MPTDLGKLKELFMVFGVEGIFGLLTTNIHILIGKTMAFERKMAHEARLYEEAIFYGVLCGISPQWSVRKDGQGERLSVVSFRFLPGSRLGGFWLERIDLLLPEDTLGSFEAIIWSGERSDRMRGMLYFID